jgi:hypothetical protein
MQNLKIEAVLYILMGEVFKIMLREELGVEVYMWSATICVAKETECFPSHTLMQRDLYKFTRFPCKEDNQVLKERDRETDCLFTIHL